MPTETPSFVVSGPPALDTYANNCSAPSATDLEKWSDGVRLTHSRLALLWSLSTLERCRKCRKVRHGQLVPVRQLPDGSVSFAGLTTCGSVWVCPACSAKVSAARALEVGTVAAYLLAEGFSLGFSTSTIRHHKGSRLDALWTGLLDTWMGTRSGRPWVNLRDETGHKGFVRFIETTYGSNGWHPHAHGLHAFDSSAGRDDFGPRFSDRWISTAARKGFDALELGQDFRPVSDGSGVAEYLTKLGDPTRIGREMTGSLGKSARSKLSTRPHWSLLDDVASTGDLDSLDLWHEWEKASHGRRQVAWSKELAPMRKDSRSDEEVASEDLGGSDLVFLTAEGWDSLIPRPHLIAELRITARAGGMASLVPFLDRHSISWEGVN